MSRDDKFRRRALNLKIARRRDYIIQLLKLKSAFEDFYLGEELPSNARVELSFSKDWTIWVEIDTAERIIQLIENSERSKLSVLLEMKADFKISPFSEEWWEEVRDRSSYLKEGGLNTCQARFARIEEYCEERLNRAKKS